MTRALLSLLAALIVGLFVAAPSPAEAVKTLYRGNQNEPDTLNPNKATGSWESNILGDLFLGLMTEDAAGNPIYGAAESHTVSPDGLVYRFTLRAGHQWSDGHPVSAHDFVFGMRSLLDPATAAEYASLLYPIKGAQEVNEGKAPLEALGVVAKDDRTVEITLVNPAPYLLQLLMHQTAYPLPKHLVDRVGRDWTKPGVMVSNGPYQLAEWTPNDRVRLVKNPLFFDAANVKIDEVIFYPTDDSESAMKRFRAGELDINNGIPSQKLDFVRTEMADTARIAPFINVRYIVFNTSRAPFDDVRVRQALSMAIDREVIAEKILRAGEVPAYALVPTGMAGYPSTAQLRFKGMPLAERQAEARRLLAEAGFGADTPLSFGYNYIADPDSKRVSVALAGFWQDIGVKADLIASEKKVHYDLLRQANYLVGESNWIADYNDAKNFLFLTQPSSGQMNTSKYSNMRFEELIGLSDRDMNPETRSALMIEAEQLMLDEHPVAPLYFGVTRSLVQPWVSGWVDNLTNVHRTRFMDVNRP